MLTLVPSAFLSFSSTALSSWLQPRLFFLRRVLEPRGERFGLADRESLFYDQERDLDLIAHALERQERLGVAHAEAAGCELVFSLPSAG